MCKLDAEIFEEINEDTTKKLHKLEDKTEDDVKSAHRTGLKI